MRSHNTSFLVFSIVLSLSLVAGSLFYGYKASASAPIFYDSSFTFYAPDYSYSESNDRADFSYHSLTFNDNILGQSAQILPGLGGVLTNNSTSRFGVATQFKISINSPELMANGGTIYIGYQFCFYEFGSYDYTYFENDIDLSGNISSSHVSIVSPASLDISATPDLRSYLSVSSSRTSLNNSSMGPFDYGKPANAIINGFDNYDGMNFPVGVGMLKRSSTSQLMEAYSIQSSKFYNYAVSDNLWHRSPMMNLKIEVDPVPSEYIDYGILIQAAGGRGGYATLASYDYQTTVTVGSESENVNFVYTPIVYICPVYAFVVSEQYYEPIEEILLDINDNLISAMGSLSYLAQLPSSEQLNWLANMKQQAVWASQGAASFATRGAYEFTTPVRQELQQELMAPIRSQEMRPFLSLLSGFLNHTKILAILTIAIVASIIGFIFFGKRG